MPQSVSQFLVQSALKEAQAVIEREELIRLSPRDWNRLFDLLEKPPKPNDRLKAAIAKGSAKRLAVLGGSERRLCPVHRRRAG